MSWSIVGIAVAVAMAALVVQQVIEPFTAGSHMGLFTNGGDLDIYRHGGLQVLHEKSLYANTIPPGGWFTYPPFAAIAFIPLAVMSFVVAKAFWMLASFAALAATVWRCATVLGWRPDRRLGLLSVALAVVALDIEAVRGTLWQGQVNIVLMAIIVWDLTRPEDSRLRGWSVGLATGVKLTAIVFVPYLLLARRWRAAATALGTAVATVVLAWAVLPSDSSDYWFHALFQTERIGPLTHPGNYSIGGIVATLWAPAPMPALPWLAGVGLAVVLGLYAALLADRSGRRLLAVSIIGLLSCTVPPLAWGHHWVWVVPLLAVLLDRVARSSGGRRWRWAVVAAATYVVTFMWFNSWLYQRSMSLGAHYPSYVDAMDAAIAEMTTADRLLAVGTHPLMFFVVAVSTIVYVRRQKPWARARPSSVRCGGDPV